MRVVEGSTALIKQMLDIGATTLLVPMVDTAEQARAVVAATRYPPLGVRGVGSAVGRASQWSARADYLQVADDEVCLLVQAETVAALQNLPAICAVDGVHGVFIGPADLAASMGHRGNPGHPEVQAAIEGAMKTIIASGKAAGTLTSDPALARRYLDLGCSFVAVGVDVLLFANAARRLRGSSMIRRWPRLHSRQLPPIESASHQPGQQPRRRCSGRHTPRELRRIGQQQAQGQGRKGEQAQPGGHGHRGIPAQQAGRQR